MARFRPVSSRAELVEGERQVLVFWEANDVFARSLALREGAPHFTFYEGPPTANNRPGIHHVLARAIKDLFPRYKQMDGFQVTRKAGWDTHGLPVELEVEKALQISGKRQIEEFGVAAFNELCRQSVNEYIDDFREMTRRLGFWIDMDHPYRTYDSTYIESVWWSLKQMWDRGLLYQDYRVAPYCPRCQTSLSSHELSQGYKDDVPDPSVYVLFEDADDSDLNYIAWTTTPWTLPGNVGLAVHPDETYVRVRESRDGRRRDIVIAKARVDVLDPGYAVVDEMPGSILVGRRYKPLFEDLIPEGKAFVIVAAPELVTMSEGTGIVHTAAAYGEADLELARREGIVVRHVVGLDGRFLEGQTRYRGLFVKDADPRIIEDLINWGRMYRAERITHTYPFCWRCDTPLIYYALTSWFIRTTEYRDRLVDLNRKTGWQPAHIRDGRMGNWLENLQDWNLSRTRYWGTPLPIWECDRCQKQVCIGSTAEIGLTVKDDLHKPFIDEVTLPCPDCGEFMHRIPEVIDAWYDSGAMPFAQWHYPFENDDVFGSNFPADFICEGLDQTRGWFFSLLAEAGILFDDNAYRDVICTGLVVDEQGRKMSKRLKNFLDPIESFDEFGADPVRWYFFSAVSPGQEYRVGKETLRSVVRAFVLTLWNTYKFFVDYAANDDWDPSSSAPSRADRHALDRWVLSRLAETVRDVRSSLDDYDMTDACRTIETFVEDVSKWYVRRSRERFWRGERDATPEELDDKAAAYATLYEVLFTTSRLLAPFMPFLAERMYRNLAGFDGDAPRAEAPISVHLTDYPRPEDALIDRELLAEMARLRKLVESGLAEREQARIKVRQPLRSATIRGERLDRELEAIFRDELNVHSVDYDEKHKEHEDVVLDTEVDFPLRLEGQAREVSRAVNGLRKTARLELSDRILLFVDAPDGSDVAKAIAAHREWIAEQTLAVEIHTTWHGGIEAECVSKVGDAQVHLGLRRA